MEGMPHFHSWLVSHRKDDLEKGINFLARNDSCSDEEAKTLANRLREAMK